MLNTLKHLPLWFPIYLYWAILLLWQNVRSVGNRSGADMIIKVGLIFMLLVVFLLRAKKMNGINTIFVLCLTATTLIQMLWFQSISLFEIVYYFYPVFLCFCVYVVANDEKIDKSQLIRFSNLVIATIWYIVIYALIFCTEQFIGAFSLQTAYGNELSSFLVSNYEYGLYLSFGILFCIINLELMVSNSKLKVYYIVTIVVFFANLILTFSRTSIIACASMIIVYLALTKKGKTKRFVMLVAFFVFGAYLLSSELRTFVNEIVFKGNANSGRSDLAELGMDLYIHSNILEQVFGMEYDKFSDLVYESTQHTSLHNAYIQTILTSGIKGIAFLIAVVFSTIALGIKTIKEKDKYRNIAAICLGLTVSSLVFMITVTGSLFASSIDSYFLTMCSIIIPKYVFNSLRSDTFDKKLKKFDF